ncbi:MAG: hypothetical protein RLZ51_2152 [Pseudomonadota bacterium]|jgi:prevent-host-death family protein
MISVELLQAESSLAQLVEAIEQGHEREIVIARNGRPVARLVPLASASSGQRIGVAKGAFEVPEPIDEQNAAVTRLFICAKAAQPATGFTGG